MTRGRCSSLRLHRDGLAPSTFRRSPGAPVHSIMNGHGPIDHLVGAGEQHWPHSGAKRLCSLEIAGPESF